jgi:hypothetical protein
MSKKRGIKVKDVTPIAVVLVAISILFLLNDFTGRAVDNSTNLTVEEIPLDVSVPEPEVQIEDIIASDEELPQGAIIVGKPVTWKKVVTLTETASDVNVSLPPEAENISVKTIVNDEEVPVENFEISDTGKLAK